MTISDAGNGQVLDGNQPRPARRNRLSGLMRMWIVMSVAWLMGGSIFLWYQVNERKAVQVGHAYQICSNKTLVRPNLPNLANNPDTPKVLADLVDSTQKAADSMTELSLATFPPDLSAAVKDAKDFSDCTKLFETPTWPWFRKGLPAILLALLVPIGLCWLVVYGPVRWIARGFQNAAP